MSLLLHNLQLKLAPNDIWGWWLYAVIVFVGIALLLQRQGSPLLGTVMLAGSIMSGLLLKITTFSLYDFFGSFLFSIILWVFPLVVVGMTKSPKSRLPALIAAVLGAIWMFAKWATLPK
jgi:hypothetical protein